MPKVLTQVNQTFPYYFLDEHICTACNRRSVKIKSKENFKIHYKT